MDVGCYNFKSVKRSSRFGGNGAKAADLLVGNALGDFCGIGIFNEFDVRLGSKEVFALDGKENNLKTTPFLAR